MVIHPLTWGPLRYPHERGLLSLILCRHEEKRKKGGFRVRRQRPAIPRHPHRPAECPGWALTSCVGGVVRTFWRQRRVCCRSPAFTGHGTQRQAAQNPEVASRTSEVVSLYLGRSALPSAPAGLEPPSPRLLRGVRFLSSFGLKINASRLRDPTAGPQGRLPPSSRLPVSQDRL